MADPYFGGGSSSGGDPYFGGGGGSRKTASPKKKGGGGIVGVLERTGANLYDAAVNMPAGVVALGKGLATDPVGTVAQVAKATAQDLRHPLRNPGYTLLDLWGIASLGAGTVARTAAVGSKLAEGARAGEVARAALTRPKPGVRRFTADNVTVEGSYSRSPLTALMQKGTDKVREERLPGRNRKRVGRELRRQERIVGGIERGPASGLIAAGRSLPLEQQTALRVVAEGVPIDERVALHQTDLATTTGRAARRIRRKISLLEGARKYVDESSGEPVIAAGNPKLETIYRKLEEVATGREDLLQRIGEIDDATIMARRQSAGRIFKGATFVSKQDARQNAQAVRQMGSAIETVAARDARNQIRSLEGLASEADRVASRTERAAYAAGTQRAAAEREALASARAADREGDKAATVRYANRDRAAAGEQAAALLARQQRLTQIAYERYQRGEVGPGVLDRAQRRLARLNAAYEGKAAAVIKMREATRTGEQVAARRDALREALVKAEQRATEKFNRLSAEAKAARARAVGKSYRVGLEKRLAQARLARLRAQVERSTADELARANQLVGAEDFQAGKVFITNRPDSGIKASLTRPPQIGANGVIGRGQRLPGMQRFTGESVHQATFGDKATELVGRSSLEAQKLGALLRLRDTIRPAVKAAPETKHDILIRLDNLGRNQPLPQISRELREKLDLGARLTPDEERQAQGAFEALRTRLLPGTGDGPLTPEAAAELSQLFEQGKVGYVDRRLLGGLDKPTPRLENWIGRRGAKVFDAVNNASRASILYLKPAYAIPNLLGNATLNVLQQGWAAPFELSRSLRLSRLDAELAARVDEMMGEGFSRALAGDTGAGSRAIQAAANFWGRGVDVPFRRASFLYEARKAGYRTPDQLRALLTDQSRRGELVQVSRRANDAIIDYANLSPTERAVIARVVFFYPWVKGSSQYAARFVADHPVETMIAAQIGRAGKTVSDRELGPLPSYLEGLIPVGRAGNGNPVTLNPASAAIFQTPAQAAAGIAGVFTGDKRSRSQLTNFSTPAVNALIELVTRRTVNGGYPITGGVQNVGYDALIRNLPQVVLARNLGQAVTGQGRDRIYPPSVRSALLQYLVGGIGTPRELNLAAARKQAAAGR